MPAKRIGRAADKSRDVAALGRYALLLFHELQLVRVDVKDPLRAAAREAHAASASGGDAHADAPILGGGLDDHADITIELRRHREVLQLHTRPHLEHQ
eukprot:4398409-Prymnesium_polylepis.1